MSNFADNFKENSVAEFFKKNRQMIGLSGKIKSLTVIIHEFTTNSIDACEEAGILPEIDVKIVELGEEFYEVHVVDNGPGIPEDKVAKAMGKLLAGTKFHRHVQQRGQQGIGASGCILFSQMTTGQPVQIISAQKDKKPIYLELTIDTAKNEPKIHSKKTLEHDFTGLAIKAKFKDVLYKDGPQSPLEYLKRLAIANPHLTIKFLDPFGKNYIFERSTNIVPKRPIEIMPHIKSITVDTLLTDAKKSEARTIANFLKESYDRAGDKVIEEISKVSSLNIKELKLKELNWEVAEKIVKAVAKVKTIAPRTDALIPIEEEHLKKSIVNIVKPESLSVVMRPATVYKGGYPFQIEAAIAYGGDAGRSLKSEEENKFEIMRFANRAPLLFDNGSCAITKAAQSIDWKRYSIKDLENTALTVVVNISSVHIPYTSAGKQAISDEDEIVAEIRQAIMQAARNISLHISRTKALADKEERKKIFYKYGTELSDSIAYLTGKSKKDIEEKLHEIITKMLAIEEAQEKLRVEKEKIDKFIEKDDDNQQEDIIDKAEKEIKHKASDDTEDDVAETDEKPKKNTKTQKKTLMDYVDSE